MPQFTPLNSRYGAPMGRHGSCHYEEIPRTINLFAVNLDSGGYDDGGAYWGSCRHGERLYCARQAASDYLQFIRASRRDAAADLLDLPDWVLIKGRTPEGLERAARTDDYLVAPFVP